MRNLLGNYLGGLLGNQPMGANGGITCPPLYETILATQTANTLQPAQAAQAQAWQQLQAAQAAQRPVISVDVLRAKLEQQSMRMVVLLPMSIAHKVKTLDFFSKDGTRPARFVLTFANTRTVEFDDIDNFPSDEHIARIALECP
jgi:hypothetical protein